MLDEAVDRAYAARWFGRAPVGTTSGWRVNAPHDAPTGDLGNFSGNAEIEAKAIRLAQYRGGATEAEMREVASMVRALAAAPRVPRFLR